jgi:hypothetical protein
LLSLASFMTSAGVISSSLPPEDGESGFKGLSFIKND